MSTFVAEFYNSVSSVIYILLAISIRFPNDRLIQWSQMWMAAIGFGSAMFHGTMQYCMQLCDEIPMVGFMTTIVVAKILTPHPFFLSSSAQKFLWPTVSLIILYSIGLCVCYVLFDKYEIFVNGFSLIVMLDGVFSCTLKPHVKHGKIQSRARTNAAIYVVLGRVAWELEHRLCAKHPEVWPLHILWHVFSCYSASQAMLATYIARASDDAELPQWRWSTTRSESKRKVA